MVKELQGAAAAGELYKAVARVIWEDVTLGSLRIGRCKTLA